MEAPPPLWPGTAPQRRGGPESLTQVPFPISVVNEPTQANLDARNSPAVGHVAQHGVLSRRRQAAQGSRRRRRQRSRDGQIQPGGRSGAIFPRSHVTAAPSILVTELTDSRVRRRCSKSLATSRPTPTPSSPLKTITTPSPDMMTPSPLAPSTCTTNGPCCRAT